MLFNADIRQNFTPEEGNLEKQKWAKETFTKKWKTWNKVYANPGLGLSAFEQPGPEVFPSILNITQNTYRGQLVERESPGRDTSYQYLMGNLKNGERSWLSRQKPLFS